MRLGDRPRRKRVEDVRCPDVKGLPDDIYHILHHSFVDLLESGDLLKHLRDEGF